MDVSVADSGPCRKTISVKIPADKVRAHVAQVYQQAAQQVDLKGFRRGKVPRRVLQQKFGDEILFEAKKTLIDDSFNEALKDNELMVVGTPKLEGVEDGPLAEDQPLEFAVVVDVRPEIEIKQTKGLEARRQDASVTEEDMTQALEQIAGQKRKLQPVEDVVQDGDFIKTALTFKNEAGEEIVAREAQLNTRIPIAGTDADTFAGALQGAAKGQTVTLELTYPATFEKEEVRGQKGSVEIEIKDVMRVVSPPIDDEFAKGFDFENLEAMRDDLRKRIGEEKNRLELQRQEEDLINALISENPFELPESLVEEQAEHSLQQFRQRLEQGGMEKEQVDQKIEEARPEARQDAERRVRLFFLLDTVARQEKIFVTEGDVEVEIRTVAAQNQVTPEQVREFHEKYKLMADLRVGIMERKVREFLREKAQFTD